VVAALPPAPVDDVPVFVAALPVVLVDDDVVLVVELDLMVSVEPAPLVPEPPLEPEPPQAKRASVPTSQSEWVGGGRKFMAADYGASTAIERGARAHVRRRRPPGALQFLASSPGNYAFFLANLKSTRPWIFCHFN
jgi:hypothetical protein